MHTVPSLFLLTLGIPRSGVQGSCVGVGNRLPTGGRGSLIISQNSVLQYVLLHVCVAFVCRTWFVRMMSTPCTLRYTIRCDTYCAPRIHSIPNRIRQAIMCCILFFYTFVRYHTSCAPSIHWIHGRVRKISCVVYLFTPCHSYDVLRIAHFNAMHSRKRMHHFIAHFPKRLYVTNPTYPVEIIFASLTCPTYIALSKKNWLTCSAPCCGCDVSLAHVSSIYCALQYISGQNMSNMCFAVQYITIHLTHGKSKISWK